MRRIPCILSAWALFASLGAGSATAQTSADKRKEYEAVTRCFAVNVNAMFDAEKSGNKAIAAKHDAMSHHAYHRAYPLGEGLGYSETRIRGDLADTLGSYRARIASDRQYFEDAKAICRSYGLLP